MTACTKRDEKCFTFLTRYDEPSGTDTHLFEGSLCEEVTLDPGQRLVGVVVSLLNQTQLLSLRLVQPRFHTEGERQEARKGLDCNVTQQRKST